jgi:hypothetical protein
MGHDSLYYDTARNELRPLERRTDGEAATAYGILSEVKLTDTKGYTKIMPLSLSKTRKTGSNNIQAYWVNKMSLCI